MLFVYYFMHFLMQVECATFNDSAINVQAKDYNGVLTAHKNDDQHAKKDAAFINRRFLPPDLVRLQNAIGFLPDGICKNDSEAVLEGIFRHETWALRLFDSSPKFPVGMLYGSYYQFGNFDECVNVITVLPQTERVLQGQYCLADVALLDSNGHQHQDAGTSRIAFNNTLHWAICIPSTCTSKDLELFLNKLLNGILSSSTIKVSVSELRCYFEQNTPYSKSEVIYGCVIGAFIVFVLMTTMFHVLLVYRNRKCLVYNVNMKRSSRTNAFHDFLLSFSLMKSVSKLLHIGKIDASLSCIFGIKFISMLLILSSHSLLFFIAGPVLNEEFYAKAITKPQNALFLNNPLLVDTFLLIGGFLMCKLLLAELDKNKGKVNVLGLYIARYVRLTPSYLVVIFFYYTVFIRLDNGPLWKERITTEQTRCMESWWANILYINNYINTDSVCMFQSWYLSVDTHLFVLAPFLIYPLWKWPKKGEIILGTVTILVSLVVFMITYQFQLDPTLMAFPPEITDVSLNPYYIFAYMKTHMRAISYCVGLIAGYCVHRLESSRTKLTTGILWIGWILACILAVSSLFSVTIFYLPQHEHNPLESAVYSALHKLGWSFSIAWIIVVCATSNAGPVQKFLSWAPFVPLSRLSYCAYLVNGAIELYSFGTLRSPVYLSIYNLASLILSHMLLTYTAAFILCIFFESPIHSIEKLVLGMVHKTANVHSKPKT